MTDALMTNLSTYWDAGEHDEGGVAIGSVGGACAGVASSPLMARLLEVIGGGRRGRQAGEGQRELLAIVCL